MIQKKVGGMPFWLRCDPVVVEGFQGRGAEDEGGGEQRDHTDGDGYFW